MRKLVLVAFSAVLLAIAGPAGIALAQSPPTKIGDTAKGKVLTNDQGMTLYTFAKDSDGKSACNGPCATNWPPLAATGDATPADSYTIIVRADGNKQWAYKGKPLYTWHNDHKPGDIDGDGKLNGAWQLARP